MNLLVIQFTSFFFISHNSLLLVLYADLDNSVCFTLWTGSDVVFYLCTRSSVSCSLIYLSVREYFLDGTKIIALFKFTLALLIVYHHIKYDTINGLGITILSIKVYMNQMYYFLSWILKFYSNSKNKIRFFYYFVDNKKTLDKFG
jgi:hypothetical protein